MVKFSDLFGGVAGHLHYDGLGNLVSDYASKPAVESAVMTTDGDLITRAGGVPARLTRAALAGDAAFLGALTPPMVQIAPAGDPINVAGTWQIGVDPNSIFGAYWLQSSLPAVGDEMAWDVLLAAGVWRLEVIHLRQPNQAIYDVRLDGTVLTTIDGYAAALTYNIIRRVTGITVAAGGRKRLSVRVTGKNASSSNMYAQVSALQLTRTDI